MFCVSAMLRAMGRTMIGCVMVALLGCGGARAREESTARREHRIEAAVVSTVPEERAPSWPLTAEGIAGGTYAAAGVRADCVGWMPTAPQAELDLASPTGLVVSVTAPGADTVLVIVGSDGSVLCNDDAVGVDPRIGALFLAGHYTIYVGTFEPGQRAAFRLVAGPPEPGSEALAAHLPGAPQACGLTVPEHGFVRVGMPVTLGAHSGWTGPDGSGGHVVDDTWWNEGMAEWVGREAVVTELGLDPIGCPYVRVDVDGGSWGWRIRNLSP